MRMDDPGFQEYAEKEASQILAKLGYEPLRPLPWREVTAPSSPLTDDAFDDDILKITGTARGIIAKIRGLDPGTDSFSLALDGNRAGMEFNRTLLEAQGYLLFGTEILAAAAATFRSVADDTLQHATELTSDDMRYAQREATRRRARAEELLAYSAGNSKAAEPPMTPAGEVISPVVAAGLARRFAMDALELTHRLKLETEMGGLDAISDELNGLLGDVGAGGSKYMTELAARLERSRRAAVQRRRTALTVVSLLLVYLSVLLDRAVTSDRIFGPALLASLGAGLLVWTCDRVLTQRVDRTARRKRLRVLEEGVAHAEGWLTFLRRQQTVLNEVRASLDRSPVKLAERWVPPGAA